ncbi:MULTISPECIES: hypothetical protein [unclassified Halomonas]|uniref:hypothetical protein n=1 Tax=unclassified Halomonas TaxID=2609666 RepID=UPI0028839AF4|nr:MULTISPECIES: hypothetical protein [unclassified Halomonas]MDT0501061.1 hypothetical protein [Halomonas sp. PAR7]MDT0513252.1 hypothetical protein [Halomonas sp. LES1]MDT0592236.1 hypothetical protein [Halomonas sp. PAR8]
MKSKTVGSCPGMRRHRHTATVPFILAALLAVGASNSQAETGINMYQEVYVFAAGGSERSVEGTAGFAAMEHMDLATMEQARAREGQKIVNVNTVKSVQKMKASVNDTSFDIGGNMVSGNITFAREALGSYSGTGIFSAVTGSGNSINNAVGISVFIAN